MKLLSLMLLLALPAVVQAQFVFTTNNDGSLNISKYTGSGGAVTIPSTTNGLPVTSLGAGAFYRCSSLTRIMIPNSVTSIGYDAFYECYSLTNITIGNGVTNISEEAFYECTSLTGICFLGNAPSLGSWAFIGDVATIYYLPGTTGWGTTLGGLPTKLWNPQVQTRSATFGVRTNQFRFNVYGTADIPIVVEACTNLGSGTWIPLQTVSLTNGSFSFSDPQWTNYPGRFYRLRWP